MGTTNLKSNIAELSVAAECAKKNWVVLFPFGENTPYDILVDTGNTFLRVQIKYVTTKDDVLNVPLKSTTGVTYKDTVDIIAVYCPDNNKVYWVDLNKEKINDINSYIRLRHTTPKNNQSKGVRLSEDYELRV